MLVILIKFRVHRSNSETGIGALVAVAVCDDHLDLEYRLEARVVETGNEVLRSVRRETSYEEVSEID